MSDGWGKSSVRNWSGSSIPITGIGMETSGNLVRYPGNNQWVSCNGDGTFSVGDSNSTAAGGWFRVFSGSQDTLRFYALSTAVATLVYNASTKAFTTSGYGQFQEISLANSCGYNQAGFEVSGTSARFGVWEICLNGSYSVISETLYTGNWITLG